MAQMGFIPKVDSTNESSNNENKGKYLIPLILITCLFFLWGAANNLNDILIKQFKKAFELSDFQSGLVQSAFYFGYFVLAMPAAMFMRKRGYKAGILLGLSLYAAGALLFYPAAESRSYGFFLFALFVIASGLAFLETAANPYVAALGSAKTAAFRLNLAQSFNPIGSIVGILIGQQFIFSGVEYSKEQLAQLSATDLQNYYATEASAVQIPYLIIGIIVISFMVFIWFTQFPKVEEEQESTEKVSLTSLFGIKHFRLAVITQFFYVGAQVGVWSYLIRYSQNAVTGMSEKDAATYLTYSLVLFMIGRFVGTALLKTVQANRLMGFYAIVCMLLVGISIVASQYLGIWALVATSFFMSIMFPTIFTLGLDGLGEGTKLGASLLVMAIIGGAVLTAVMGLVSDLHGIKFAQIVPVICFGVVAFYGFKGSKAVVE
ncbi:MAG: L-fucose:H+ symporter permease [Bacteroidota bacterium]|jgi:FHS family L-fucose permease-like MFS transporter